MANAPNELTSNFLEWMNEFVFAYLFRPLLVRNQCQGTHRISEHMLLP